MDLIRLDFDWIRRDEMKWDSTIWCDEMRWDAISVFVGGGLDLVRLDEIRRDGMRWNSMRWNSMRWVLVRWGIGGIGRFDLMRWDEVRLVFVGGGLDLVRFGEIRGDQVGFDEISWMRWDENGLNADSIRWGLDSIRWGYIGINSMMERWDEMTLDWSV